MKDKIEKFFCSKRCISIDNLQFCDDCFSQEKTGFSNKCMCQEFNLNYTYKDKYDSN